MKVYDVRLNESFDKLAHIDPETEVEFWYARDLVKPLGYTRWQTFFKVIEKAMESCETADGAGKVWLPDRRKPSAPANKAKTTKHTSQAVSDHFTEVSNMVKLGSGSQRKVQDFKLTRYACYLICQNGDPSKEAIALAQRYFAQQTRKQEIKEEFKAIESRLNEREKLAHFESGFSGDIYEKTRSDKAIAKTRSAGDKALFNHSTKEMKERLGIPHRRPLADFLPETTISAKGLAAQTTRHNIKKKDLNTEDAIKSEHMENNAGIRAFLLSRGIKPEDLEPAPDCKKEKRLLEKKKKQIEAEIKPQQAVK